MKNIRKENFPAPQNGLMLLEAALVLALVALLISPLMNLQKTLSAGDKQNEQKAEYLLVSQALQGFVMTQGRLPCPALIEPESQTPSLPAHEARMHQQCNAAHGPLPTASLGLPSHLSKKWTLSVASLERAGPPASFSLFRDNIFESISLQALREVILQPETASNGLDKSALPAIHLCLRQEGTPEPAPEQAGCNGLPLHSPSVLLVAHRHHSELGQHSNTNRYQQFFIHPNHPEPDLVWMDLNQFVWLRMTAGWGL